MKSQLPKTNSPFLSFYLIVFILVFTSVCELYFFHHYHKKIDSSLNKLQNKTGNHNNDFTAKLIASEIDSLTSFNESSKAYLNEWISNKIQKLPSFSESISNTLTGINPKIHQIKNELDSIRETLSKRSGKNSYKDISHNKIHKITISGKKDIIDYPVFIDLPLNKINRSNNFYIIDHDNKPVFYWIEPNSKKLRIWFKIDALTVGSEKIFHLVTTKSKVFINLKKYYHNGKKVFSFFSSKNHFSDWELGGEYKPEKNVILSPLEHDLLIDTSLHKKDTGINQKFNPVKENCILEYVFMNHSISVPSFQFQTSLRDSEGKLISALDSPIYGRTWAAFRRQTDSYREILFGKMHYNEWYKARHVIRFDTQKVDYHLQSLEYEDASYELKDQYFQTGGMVPHDQNPKANNISNINMGNCCLDDLGKTSLQYIFIRKLVEPEPDVFLNQI